MRATACLIGMLTAVFGLPARALPPAVPSASSYDLTLLQREQLEALRTAWEHGLDPADYELERLEAMAAGVASDGGQQLVAALHSSYQVFAQDVAFGRVTPGVADPDWHVPGPPDYTGSDNEFVAPPHAAYERLREAMTRFVAIQRDGGWPRLAAEQSLSVGMRDEQVVTARNRLRLTGDFEGDTQADAWLFGANLDAAVRRFQTRHGLFVDGVIGDATREAMNVPVEARIQQLAIAMERWRWLPRDLGDEYAWVNAAELTLEVISYGDVVFSSRTIVGHSSRATPTLRSEIRQLVFNPTWTVPTTIAAEDLLPKIQRIPGYLENNAFRVYEGWDEAAREVDPADIDWTAVSATRLPYRFVQMPGPDNSLGMVKMIFDNPFDIYLHDTPSKGLFALRTRMFSSGCIRLEQAHEFSDFLLANYREPGDTTTAQWLEDPRTRFVDLQRRLPIYLVYITSWVTEAGEVNFRRDLYHRDAAVANALRNRSGRLAGN